MAFNRNTAAARTTSASNDSWKSQGFINIYLPTNSGGQKKFGALGLREAYKNEKATLAYLREDPEAHLVRLGQMLMLEYVDLRDDEPDAFALPGFEAVRTEPTKERDVLAYLNFYVPSKAGAPKKIGAIALRADNRQHVALTDWLSEDTEQRAKVLLEQMIFQFVDLAAADTSELAFA